MAEHAKTTPSAGQDPSYAPPTVVSYPHQAYNDASFTPPGPSGTYMPQLFSYPPPPDGSDVEVQNGSVPAPPYMMSLPGVFYAYPSHPQAPGVLPFIDCSSTGAHSLQTQVLDLHPQIQALLHQPELNANRSKWL